MKKIKIVFFADGKIYSKEVSLKDTETFFSPEVVKEKKITKDYRIAIVENFGVIFCIDKNGAVEDKGTVLVLNDETNKPEVFTPASITEV